MFLTCRFLAVAVLSVVLLACAKKTPEEALAAAQAFAKEKKYEAAIIELKSAIIEAPSDLQLRKALANAYMNVDDYQGADKELSRVLQLADGGHDEILPLVMQVKAKLKLTDDALDIANTLMQRETDSQEVHYGLFLVTRELLANGRDAEIAPLLQYITAKSPDSTSEHLTRAWLSFEQQNYALTEQLVETVLTDNPAQLDALELKALVREETGLHEQAVTLFSELHKEKTGNADVMLHLAHNLILVDELDQAEKYLATLLKTNRIDPVSNMLMAAIMFEREQYANAKELAETALSSQPQLPRARLIAGISAFRVEAFEQAYNHLVKIDQELPSAHQARRILQVLRLQLGYVDELAEQLEKSDEFDPDLYATAAFELIRQGRPEQAKPIADKLSGDTNLDENTLPQRGILKLALDDQSGFDDLEKAVRDYPEQDQFRYLLVSEYIGAERFNEALDAVESWLNINASNDSAYLFKGIALQQTGSLDDATEAFNKAVELNPENVGALVNLALQNVLDRNFQSASDYFGRVLLVRPDYFVAIMHLHRMAETEADLSLAQAPLEQALQQHPESLQLALGLARIFDNFDESTKAQNVLSALPDETKTHPAYLSLVGSIQLKGSQYEAAEKTYRKMIEQVGNVAIPYRRLIAVYELQRKFPLALDIARQGANKFPQAHFFVQMEAYFLTLLNKFEEAERILSQLERDNIHSTATDKARARIAASKGQTQQVVDSYYSVYNRAPTPVNTVNLARSLVKYQDAKEAEKLLNEHHNRFGDSDFTLAYLGEVLLKTDPAKAVETYTQLLADKPNNVAYLNNLAQAYIKTNEPGRAIDIAKQAHANSNGLVQVKDTLGWAHFKAGNIPEALNWLAQAYAGSENDEIKQHYATVLEANGEFDKAKEILNDSQ